MKTRLLVLLMVVSGLLLFLLGSPALLYAFGTRAIITTVAGDGTACENATDLCGDNELASAAQLQNPFAATVDKAGNIYFADTGTNRIRKVISPSGIITAVAGTITGGFNGDNQLAVTALLSNPIGVGLDEAGNLYIRYVAK